MDDCIFCQIVKGNVPAQKVYEDDKTYAFLTIEPFRPGHTLVIPKLHTPDIFNLPKEDYDAVMDTAYKIAPALQRAYKPIRVGALVAGFDVPHAHLHLVPLHEHNDLTSKRLLDGKVTKASSSELEVESAKIIKEIR